MKPQKTVLLGTTMMTKPRALHGKHTPTAHSEPRLQRSEALASDATAQKQSTSPTTAADDAVSLGVVHDDGSGGADAPSKDNGVTTTVEGTPENGGSEPSTALPEARAQIIRLIAARGRKDRYAALLSRCRTSAACILIEQVFGEVAAWQRRSGKRVRKFRAKSGQTYHVAIERFVGDLLRARGDNKSSGRIYHATGATTFDDVPVNYDVFMGMLKGLVALGFVGFNKGGITLRKTGERAVLDRRATTFWATDKLVKLAEHFGVPLENIGAHFTPEPPHNPLVLRAPGAGKGVSRERGPIIKRYKRTETTKRLEAEVRELNGFLARCEINGGEHHGYTRNFNLASWRKGGRLYSVGGGYQNMSPSEKRLEMTINGEAVAEIDIKASHLTIYHAKFAGTPLSRDGDPYERVGADRPVAKQWTVASFGNSKPATRWPPKMIKDYKEETGLDLSKVAKATDVKKKMLEAFPALQKLEHYSDIWADLQFIEAEAVISTMLVLIREHRIPSLSMHDGIIVPRSGVGWTKTILTQQYWKFVGVEPVQTVEPEEADYVAGTDL
jgi:hypothetical protein